MAKAEEKIKKKEEPDVLALPKDVSVSSQENARDLAIISIPKMGKGTILGDFTRKYNALVLDLEKGGYEYISARKMSIYPSDETTLGEAFENYVKIRSLLLENAGKYDYLIIDGLSDLDILSEIGGTYAYMGTAIGKNFNRREGEKLKWGDPEFRLVTTLPEGFGYQHSRKWFLDQLDIFRRISPYRLYAAHVADKYIKDNNKEQVVGSEIFLTGKLKNIFASRVTSLAKLVADGNERYLNFEALNDSIIAGSRNPRLSGRILISNKGENGEIKTFWENIYN
jgi:hypothetical protein